MAWPSQWQGVTVPSRILRQSPNQLDPGLYLPYAIGREIQIQGNSALQVFSTAGKGSYTQWRIHLRTERLPGASPPGTVRSFPLVWTVLSSSESGIISRTLTVLDGSAQGTFAFGRSLELRVQNPTPEVLRGFFALDQGDPSSEYTWQDGELASVSAAEFELAIPPFAYETTLQWPESATDMIILGKDPSGATRFQLTVPGATATYTLALNPWLTYTLSTSGAAYSAVVGYTCRG